MDGGAKWDFIASAEKPGRPHFAKAKEPHLGQIQSKVLRADDSNPSAPLTTHLSSSVWDFQQSKRRDIVCEKILDEEKVANDSWQAFALILIASPQKTHHSVI